MRELVTPNSQFHLKKVERTGNDEYRTDFAGIMAEKEKIRLPFAYQAPQINFRGNLIELIKKICEIKGLSNSCLHLAVYILDIFMDNHSIITQKLFLVANVCLLISAKFEENSHNIPKIAELNRIVHDIYEYKEYITMEVLILNFFDFYIMYPTTAHYIYYYTQETLCQNRNHRHRDGIYFDLHLEINKFLDEVIQEIHYMQCCPPSKLAAAIIAASRKKIGLDWWNPQLEQVSGYARDDMHPVVNCLITNQVPYCTQCASQ